LPKVTKAPFAALRADAAALFRAAVADADPTRLVASFLVRSGTDVAVETADRVVARWRTPTLVIGAGKPAAHMAAACEQVLGARNVSGEVVVADGCGIGLQSIKVTEAGHPVPDVRGEKAAGRLIQLLTEPAVGGILCLIGGGASSLLVRPRPPVSLKDKIRTTELLLECGAEIGEFNTVRKHLSDVKGGGLLRHTRTRIVSLIVSDVVGDDPSTIGSGPTAPDPTTFADAWSVLGRYALTNRVPTTVVEVLKRGLEGQIAETVKPNTTEAALGCNLIVGSNQTALSGAAREARALGWMVNVQDEPLTGDTTVAALRLGHRIRELKRRRRDGQPLCVLAGGETTVRVIGKGRGGRNQEFALALVGELADEEIVVLSAGTDGIDGPTDAAGAFVDGTTLQRARRLGLDPQSALRDNNSYAFFSQLGDLYRCGPTGTNVMDIKIALVPPVPRPT
jgi:glycerate 2-kinase